MCERFKKRSTKQLIKIKLLLGNETNQVLENIISCYEISFTVKLNYSSPFVILCNS